MAVPLLLEAYVVSALVNLNNMMTDEHGCIYTQPAGLLFWTHECRSQQGRSPRYIVLPAKLRRRLGVEEGSFVVAEERADGILIRPATVLPVKIYSAERRAGFMLNNIVDAGDCRRAQAEVKRMGLDPDRINHHRR
jgi:AbrB family looped-hinge helix DNA binding protein